MIRLKNAGADASAEWFDICVLVKALRHRTRFPQTQEGFAALLAWLKELGLGKIWVSIEHTGGYERKLALWLLAHGHRVSLVDPQQVLSFKRSMGRRAKTDELDAYVLARFTKERRPALWVPRPDPYQQLLELVRHRQSLVDALTQWKNRRSAPKTNELVHRQQQTLIEVLSLQVEEVERHIRELLESEPEISNSVDLIQTIKGVKFLTAVAFLAEAGPISGYPTPESLALSAGLVPLVCQSGKGKKVNHRPYGNERLRQSVAMAASVARRHNPALSFFAARIAAKGGKSLALQNKAVRRKLCHIIWGVLHNQESFNPNKAVRGFTSDA
jgi:transposase